MNGWKVVAIFFIFLFALTFGTMIWAYIVVGEDVDRENECMFNVCVEEPYYIYVDFKKVCECYNEDYELTKEVYLK